MKKSVCLSGALALIFGTAASAAEPFTAYNLDINYTNLTAQYWSVNGAPSTTGTSFLQIFPSATSVQTDGSGHITGTGQLTVTYSASGVPFSVFYVDYSGRISSSANVPTSTTITIKGPGYTVDGTGGATAINNTINLKFIGQPAINPLNKNQTRIVGTLTGRISGSTPMGVNQSIPEVQAVFAGSASRGDFLEIQPDVLQSTRHIQIFNALFSGNGTISGTTYKFSTHGLGTSRGETLAVNGFMGTYTNLVGTNGVGFTAPISAELKGKKKGQVVSGSATPDQIVPVLITTP